MAKYDHGDPKRIHHFLKVHDFAATIGALEGLSPRELFTLETAAIVHDIGIHVSEQKYGSSNGKYQEQEGPAEARKLLVSLGYEQEVIERVCFLVGHHHTYTHIDALDYQILVEADFLVNCYEDNLPLRNIENCRDRIFKTITGRRLLSSLYLEPRTDLPTQED
jgi:hypothetical protein